MAECRDTTAEDLQYNPKDDVKSFKARHARALSFLKFKNPIPEQTRDQDDLQKLFEKYLLVPFAGSDQYTGHRYLSFLRLLRNYSETHGSCCESKLEFSFGGMAKVKYETDDFFDFEDDVEEKSVPVEQKKLFAKYARQAINWDASSIRQFVENAVDDWLWCGNYYVELIHTVTAGIWKTYAYVRYPEDCIYLWSEAYQQKVIATSPSWDLKYITDHPPNLLPVYPVYKREGNKWSTIIHEMHGNFPWYGRPNSRHAILPMYNEFQNSEFMVKHAHAMFMAQILLEAEDGQDPEQPSPFDDAEAKEAGFDNSIDRIEMNWTAKSNQPGSVIATTRPYGAKPMLVHEFKPYTNENYYEKVGNVNEKKIIRAHSWSSRLLGDSVANGLSTNVFKDEFGVKAATNIRKLQNMGDWLTNTVIQEAMKFHAFKGMEDLRLAFKSPFEEMLEQTEELKEESGKPEQ